MAIVSSHILDSVSGGSASGIRVELFRLEGPGQADRYRLFGVTADGDGRISQPMDIEHGFRHAQYELVYHSAEYFRGRYPAPVGRQIVDAVVVRVTMPDPDARYHIPLVLSPHSYTVWWSG